jgi:tetratricopeptide (TPR) repeat protein
MTSLENMVDDESKHLLGYLYIVLSTLLGQMMRRLQESVAAAEKGLALLPPYPTAARLRGLLSLSAANYFLNGPEASLPHTEKGITVAKTLGNKPQLTTLYKNQGSMQQKIGDLTAALESQQQGLELAQEMGNTAEIVGILNNLTMIYIIQGEDQIAIATIGQAITLAQNQPLLLEKEVVAKITSAHPLIRASRLDEARTNLEQAWSVCLERQLANLLPSALSWLAEVSLAQEDYEAGLNFAEQAIQLAQDRGMAEEVGIAWSVKGKLLDATRQFVEAEQAHQTAVSELEAQERYVLGRAISAQARHYILQDGKASVKAQEKLREALTIFTPLNAKYDLRLIETLLI